MWRDIPGFEGIYQINPSGKVKSLARTVRGVQIQEKLLKPTIRENGNIQYGLSNNGKIKNHYAHILVADLYDREVQFLSIKGESWAKVEGTENLEVSNFGRVRTLHKTYCRDSFTYCLYREIRVCDNGKGYKQVFYSNNGVKKSLYVHRLVAEAFLSNGSNKPEVNHIDCDKSNNHFTNLEYCTAKENKEHALANKLIKTGTESHRAKLNKKQVKEIKKSFVKNRDSAVEFGKRYGVSNRVILDIYNNATYIND